MARLDLLPINPGGRERIYQDPGNGLSAAGPAVNTGPAGLARAECACKLRRGLLENDTTRRVPPAPKAANPFHVVPA